MMRALSILSLILFAGCDALGDDNEMEGIATVIMDILADPNPVSVADTTHIQCVYRDSLESGFTFDWALSDGIGRRDLLDTETCEVDWVAPAIAGDYKHELDISRSGYRTVRQEFTVTVVDN